MTHFVHTTKTGLHVLACGMVPLDQVVTGTNWVSRNVERPDPTKVRVISRNRLNVTFEYLSGDRRTATVDNFRFQCAFYMLLDDDELPSWAV